jgi:hypothetical protein
MTEPCPTLGFFVTIDTARSSSQTARDAFRARWLDFLGGRGLYAMSAARDGRRWAVGSEASQASELDCEAARAWLSAQPEVHHAEVGSIEDLNEAS